MSWFSEIHAENEKRKIKEGRCSNRSCYNPGKMQHEGQWYCGMHDPVKRAERQAVRDAAHEAKYTAKVGARIEQQRRADLFDELLEALRDFRELAIFRKEVVPNYVDDVIAKAEGKSA